MFKNSVLKKNVNTVDWFRAAGIRAVKTFAQTFVATVGSATVLGAVDWKMAGSASLLSAILSVAVSVAGIPEVKGE